MKKIILITLLLNSFLFSKLNVALSIAPQKTFVEAIGGDKVDITLMVLPGNSPHTYEPKPSQMKDIAQAKLYFGIDVEFEHTWLPRFQSLNKEMKIVDLDEGIDKMVMGEHHHEDEHGHENEHGDKDDHETDHKDQHKGTDPHIWTSPKNVKIIAKNILEALIKADSSNTNYYKTNYNKFISHIDATDAKIKSILQDIPNNTKFIVFHPAWGYFAAQYNLTQMAIEVSGKNPKPKQIAHLIEEAKEENAKAIFTAPEFSEKIAKQIASEVEVPVIKISPLNPKWSQNLINLANAIANK